MANEPIVDLFVGLAWPLVVSSAIIMFRAPTRDLIGRLQTLKVDKGKLSVEFQKALAMSEAEARNAEKMPDKPTTAELERGERIAASNVGWDNIRVIALELAAEYDRIRATMPSGSDRTRAMTGVIAKMRTLGAVIFLYRYDFIDAASPGRRLLVIASLQVTPDLDLSKWLRERILEERPFIGFHAIGALQRTLTAPAAPHERGELKAIISEIDQKKDFKGDPGRESAFKILLEKASKI